MQLFHYVTHIDYIMYISIFDASVGCLFAIVMKHQSVLSEPAPTELPEDDRLPRKKKASEDLSGI